MQDVQIIDGDDKALLAMCVSNPDDKGVTHVGTDQILTVDLGVATNLEAVSSDLLRKRGKHAGSARITFEMNGADDITLLADLTLWKQIDDILGTRLIDNMLDQMSEDTISQ